MLADACPFAASDDGEALGVVELVGLAVTAHADPGWALPLPLQRAVVVSALRVQRRRETEPWMGFLHTQLRQEEIWCLEIASPAAEERAVGVRNALRCGLAALGGSRQRGKWGKVAGERQTLVLEAYLHTEFISWIRHLHAPPPVTNEAELLDNWCAPHAAEPPCTLAAALPTASSTPDGQRMVALDEECVRAACDVGVCPSLLLLLQAFLGEPPSHQRKHVCRTAPEPTRSNPLCTVAPHTF